MMERKYATVEENQLLFAKVREDAKIPTKDDANAGYDIYACFDEDFLVIPAHQTVLVPTGLACAMTEGYYMQIEERGSTGSKGMKKSAGVVDSGYRGEIFVAITNCNHKDIVILKDEREGVIASLSDDFIVYPYSKAICQGVIHRVEKMDVATISYEELLSIPSNRGTGALGSSGK